MLTCCDAVDKEMVWSAVGWINNKRREGWSSPRGSVLSDSCMAILMRSPLIPPQSTEVRQGRAGEMDDIP